jgi:hypothetical protein
MYVRTFKTYIIGSIKGSLIGRAVIMYVRTFKTYIIVSPIRLPLILTIMLCFEGSNIHYHSSSYQTSFDTNNNVCFEGSNIHYHSSSYQTSFNTNNNVGFNLHNCLYFLYLSTLLQHITYWFYLHLNIA